MSQMPEHPDGLSDTDGVQPQEQVETGDPVIDAALDRLVSLDSRPVHEHPAEFEQIHKVLREALASAGRDVPTVEAP